MAHTTRLVILANILVALGGCFDDDPHVNRFPANNGNEPPPVGNEPPPVVNENSPPTITGTPPTSIVEGELYEFIPTAEDPDGDPLRFTVYHKPDWASFDQATGRIWGTPGSGDVGTFSGVTIAAWDGLATATLGPFTITVGEIAMGSATLIWSPPIQNTDSTPLTDLAGFKIYYGTDPDILGRVIQIDNPGLTRYVVENLRPAKWYFKMTSVNSLGVESERTAIVSWTIS